MRPILITAGVACIVVGAVLLVSGAAQALAVGLLVAGLTGVGFSAGGRAGA